MSHEHCATQGKTPGSAEVWQEMFRDRTALLAQPGRHHRALIESANSLHRAQIISGDELSDFLELADGALAYAIEALLDIPHDD